MSLESVSLPLELFLAGLGLRLRTVVAHRPSRRAAYAIHLHNGLPPLASRCAEPFMTTSALASVMVSKSAGGGPRISVSASAAVGAGAALVISPLPLTNTRGGFCPGMAAFGMNRATASGDMSPRAIASPALRKV